MLIESTPELSQFLRQQSRRLKQTTLQVRRGDGVGDEGGSDYDDNG